MTHSILASTKVILVGKRATEYIHVSEVICINNIVHKQICVHIYYIINQVLYAQI